MLNNVLITGKLLRTMRQEAGLSQQEVARLAGISQAHVAKIEAERVDPRLSTVNRMVSVLHGKEAVTKCRDIMTKNLVFARPDDHVDKVVRMMRSFSVSQVPVLRGRTQVGSIRESTIMRNLDRNLKSLRVVHIIDKPFPVLNADDTIEMLPSLLDFHSAVLITERGKIAGIITKSDLLSIK
jgi:predicted transcriptional regulator